MTNHLIGVNPILRHGRFAPALAAQAVPSAPAKPRVLVVSRSFDVWSEVWIRRQLAEFSHVQVNLLCWDTPQDDTLSPYPTYSVGLDFYAPSRWWRRLRLLPTGNIIGADGLERQRLEQAVLAAQPDVLLCHFGPTALRILPVAEALDLPVVAHFHGHDLSTLLRHRYYAFSLRSCARRLAHCVVVGTHQRRILRHLGVHDSAISLIPCGAPTGEFTPKLGYHSDACRFVAVSRLVPWKGVDYTLRAFAEVRRLLPASRLEIVGTGPAEADLRRLVTELGLAEAVTFHGVFAPRAVHALMLHADVFVQHSLDYHDGWQEGFGVSITEASATGLPVVVTSAGGIGDQIVDEVNGLLTPQRDVPAMAQRMLRLATDEALRRRLGTAGRHRAARDLDSAMLARRLERLLRSVARASDGANRVIASAGQG